MIMTWIHNSMQIITTELVFKSFESAGIRGNLRISYEESSLNLRLTRMLEELMASGKIERGDTIFCLVPESARFSYAYIHLTAV